MEREVLNLTQVIKYGGSYQENWNSDYKLSIQYTGQKSILLQYSCGLWKPLDDCLPDLPMADYYFQQAANAAVAVRKFLASGLMPSDLTQLCPVPCQGPVFAAECMRILMDDYGLQLETIYPYVVSAWGRDLSDWECDQLSGLQPRTCRLLKLLQKSMQVIPPVLHDTRSAKFRKPYGAVPAGSRVHLAIESKSCCIRAAELEVYVDQQKDIYPMLQTETGWETDFSASDQPAALWYRFRVKLESSEYWVVAAEDGFHAKLTEEPGEGFRLTVYKPEFETPKWFQHAVLYQVFPDRFGFSEDDTAERGIAYHRKIGQNPELHSSLEEEVRWKPRGKEPSYLPDDFYGGTLNGIRYRLPYLKQLGITCLYLNPIFEARSNHRYDTSDYLRIDPILGSNRDFELLCKDARSMGIRILCDGVFSHTGADSIYFNRDGHYPNPGACQKEHSPYDSWYDFKSFPDDYRCWWGFLELPEVEETDPGWQDFIISGENSVLRQWLRRGAAGWRLDVADELPDDVLNKMRQAVKSESREYVLLGEVWEDAVIKESYGKRRNYALGCSLDSVMNYPLRTAVLDFLRSKTSAYDLSAFLTSQRINYPEPLYLSLMNLLGSHDVERLLTALAVKESLKELNRDEQLALEESLSDEDMSKAGDLARLAYSIIFSIPGVPSIYYGDELGMTGTNDPFNRRPYGIHAESDLRDYLSKLILRRKQHPALCSENVFFLAANQDVLLILSQDASEAVLTAVNRSPESRPYDLQVNGVSASGELSAYGWDTKILSKSAK